MCDEGITESNAGRGGSGNGGEGDVDAINGGAGGTNGVGSDGGGADGSVGTSRDGGCGTKGGCTISGSRLDAVVIDAASRGRGRAGGTSRFGGGSRNDGAVAYAATKLRSHDEVALMMKLDG